MTKLRNLSDEDVDILRYIYRRFGRGNMPRRAPEQEQYHDVSPDIHFVKLPTGGLTERDETDKIVGVDCDVYAPKVQEDSEDVKLEAVDGFTLKVYNPYKVKWFAPPTGVQLIKVMREKYGYWICEKPPYVLKVKPVGNINPGSHGECKVFIGGTDSGEVIDVTLNWMHGGQRISAGKEALARFFEDEVKWIFENAECETT